MENQTLLSRINTTRPKLRNQSGKSCSRRCHLGDSHKAFFTYTMYSGVTRNYFNLPTSPDRFGLYVRACSIGIPAQLEILSFISQSHKHNNPNQHKTQKTQTDKKSKNKRSTSHSLNVSKHLQSKWSSATSN